MNDDKNANNTNNDAEVSKEQPQSTGQSIPITMADSSDDSVAVEAKPTEPSVAPAENEQEATVEPAEQTAAEEEPQVPEEPAASEGTADSEATESTETPVEQAEPAATEALSTTPAVEPGQENAEPISESGAPVAAPVPANSGTSSRKKFVIFGLIAVVVIGLLIGAWLSFSGSSKKDSSVKSATVVTDVAVLRVGDVNGPIGTESLFPNAPGAQTAAQIDFQVYEGLVGYNNQRIVPLLAESWTNPDSNTWVFKLKQGVTFQNGKPVTAADVKTSLDALAKDGYWGQFMQTVANVSTNGQNEVIVKTSSPDSLLLNRLVYGFVYQTNADKTVSGTGAYTVDAANSKTEDKTRLVAYEGYHQGKPKTKVVEYTIYPDYTALVKDLNDKKIDYAAFIKNSPTAQQVAAATYAGTDYNTTGAYGITQNMIKATSPLQKLEVRQALAYALDRAAYITEAKSSKLATNYVVPKTVVGYDETAAAPDFNSAKAKELAAKAGYPNGVPLTFNYINGLQKDVPVLVSILNKSGFNITAKPFATPKEFVAANAAGNYDLFIGTFSSDLGDGLDIFSGLLGSKTSQFPAYNNPAFDKMLADASQAFKAEDHVKKVQEINRYVKDNALYLPVSNGVFTIYYPKTYNFVLDSEAGVVGTYFWKLGNTQTTTTNN